LQPREIVRAERLSPVDEVCNPPTTVADFDILSSVT
jgi:hypothetical protein